MLATAYFWFMQCLAFALGVTHARLQTAVLLLITGNAARRFTAWQSVGPLLASMIQLTIGFAYYRQNRSLAWVSGHIDPRECQWATSFFFLATLFYLGLAIVFLCTEREQNQPAETSTATDPKLEANTVKGTTTAVPTIQQLTTVRCLVVAFTATVTYSVFPSLTSRIRSSTAEAGTALALQLVFSSAHFVLFHLGGCIGQCLPLRMNVSAQIIFTLARFAFIPAFKGCNFPTALQSTTVSDALHRVPSVFASDKTFIPLLFSFGLTDGILNRAVRLTAPELDDHAESRLLSLWSAGGMILGACFSTISVRW